MNEKRGCEASFPFITSTLSLPHLIVLLADPDEVASVIPAASGLLYERRKLFLVYLRCARQDPQVSGAFTAYQGKRVILIDHHHAIIAIERPTERDAHQSGYVCCLSPTFTGFPSLPFPAGIDNLDPSAIVPTILGNAVVQVPLEEVVKTGYLVPFADIPVEVQFAHRCVIHRRTRASDKREEHRQQCGHLSAGLAGAGLFAAVLTVCKP